MNRIIDSDTALRPANNPQVNLKIRAASCKTRSTNIRDMNTLLTIVAILLLLPTTLLYATGLVAMASGIFSIKTLADIPGVMIPTLWLLLAGYGLYAVWWLVIQHRSGASGVIPKRVWVGLTFGTLTAALLLAPYFSAGFPIGSRGNPRPFSFLMMLAWGAGPLLVVVSLLARRRPWRQDPQRD